ncbi:nucleoside-diphosphate-sugar epimerase [Prauserella isguenensis]|uniref:Nucleoside-diphosphate-sugar epimerase n=1 Tax=Prauserella isguenensis TaxID=1470180 RepID=A0A839RXD3_9PSEU|nr:NAD(P)-dependent oxidoreductase [Prauserella isguenensis]MBB3050298.1 nucleoside-diphosphate-sugar epimerase [Prauserella isguenensis]
MERYLVTGSAGHLGEAVVRSLRARGDDVVGLDILDSPFTSVPGSITDRDVVRRALDGVTRVLHTATLHKPHVGSHTRQDFVDVNVTGTLTVLEEAAAAGVRSVVFTSSTSAFGRALTPAPGEPAAWITEDVRPVVRNVYGATKIAAEDLCELLARELDLPVVVLRTSRFFPEGDDRGDVRNAFDDTNLKVNEYAYRRVDLEDVVDAHLLAAHRAPELGFDRFIISATTPFTRADTAELATDAPAVFARVLPDVAERYEEWGWRMLPTLDRVYSNERALTGLGWRPRYDIRAAVELAGTTGTARSPTARAVGAKGYHPEPTGVYTT